MRRVVITGIGLATPLGIGTAETWKRLVEGESAVGPIEGFDASSLQTRIGAEIRDFQPRQIVSNAKALRKMTRSDQLALVAATLAGNDAERQFTEEDGERGGLFIGGNKEISDPMHVLEATLASRNEDGSVDMLRFGESASSTAYPLFFVEGLQAASLFYVSDAFGLKGANTYFAGTAESGAVAIGRGYRAIKRGEADLVFAGGFDDAVSWWNMTKMDAMGLLTNRNDLGAAACRPYDADRSGTVLGDGAAFVLLEEYGMARERGAKMYAEVTGFGSGYDAYKMITPHPKGRGTVLAIHAALREAGSAPADIGYVASHGNATVLGDASEAAALRTVFGASPDRVAASSVKPATGHLVAAAGALNAAIAALALHHQKAPPTLNLVQLDPACEFDWIPNEARAIETEQALALARGLEGQNVALALKTISSQ
jgi:3-oxoacyl-[acyl-carrier-protein] synthase II